MTEHLILHTIGPMGPEEPYLTCGYVLTLNSDRLLANLDGDKALRDEALAVLIEAVTNASPFKGKTSALRAGRAPYVLAEKFTESDPRQVNAADMTGLNAEDPLTAAIEHFEDDRDAIDRMFGRTANDSYTVNALMGEGTMADLIEFCLE